jgi:hypothetical protein
MDPNEALRMLRALTAKQIDANPDGKNCLQASADRAELLAEHFEALDEWLKKGGFLPDTWRPLDTDP